jgi:predicted Zn-dependent peptidase
MIKKQNVKYTRYILPNGIKCILYKRPDVHSVSVAVTVNTGSLDENEKISGISHIIEHVTFDGTRDFKGWEAVNGFLNSISGDGNASTGYEDTKYYGYFPHQYVNEAVYYISQLVLHPSLDEPYINKERTIVLDEMKRYEDSVDHHVFRNIVENRFSNNDNSFVFDIIGSEENIQNFKKADLVEYYEKYYRPENIEVYVVGNFNTTTLKKTIKKHFYEEIKDRSSKKPERNFKKIYPEYSGFKIHTKKKLDLDQYYLTMSFPGFDFASYSQEDRVKLNFLKSITASSQYFNSVLWKKLREELGLVYGVSAWNFSMFNRAFFTIDTSFKPEHLETVLTELYKGINLIKTGTVGRDIFETKKKRIADTEAMTLDSPDSVMDWIIDQENEYEQHKKSLTINEYIELIKSLKFEDVIKLSETVYDWEKVNIGLTSSDDDNEVKKKIEEIWDKVTSNK